jgi:hypothetical protein
MLMKRSHRNSRVLQEKVFCVFFEKFEWATKVSRTWCKRIRNFFPKIWLFFWESISTSVWLWPHKIKKNCQESAISFSFSISCYLIFPMTSKQTRICPGGLHCLKLNDKNHSKRYIHNEAVTVSFLFVVSFWIENKR